MSISMRFNENWKSLKRNDQKKEENKSLTNFKHWLALRSCTKYQNGLGHIDPYYHPAKVDFMFNKKIKLFISSEIYEIVLITENGEEYCWHMIKDYEVEHKNEDETIYGKDYKRLKLYIYYCSHKMDWSNTYVIKTATSSLNSLTLIDNGKIYYTTCNDNVLSTESIHQINIKGKITCIGCGFSFFVVVTDNDKTYSWGENFYGQLGQGWSEKGSEWATSQHFTVQPKEVTELSGKTIVKVACGKRHTLALTDEGKVYAWGSNCSGQSNFNSEDNVLSPVMVNIANVKKVSDIATMDRKSFVKSSDGLVYMWGCLARMSIRKPVVCEYTNVFDVCNSMMAQSPISMIREYTDQESSILNDLKTAFDDRSTSDLTIVVKKQSIYVHKAILKIRSPYFRKMFQPHYTEHNKSVIIHKHYSYVIYKNFLQYLYTGTINLASLKDLLDLLILADEYCEQNLERDCIRIIKRSITVSNVFLINKTAIQCNKTELEEYCFDFFLKNQTDVMQSESFTQLDINTKITFITKANNFFTSNF